MKVRFIVDDMEPVIAEVPEGGDVPGEGDIVSVNDDGTRYTVGGVMMEDGALDVFLDGETTCRVTAYAPEL